MLSAVLPSPALLFVRFFPHLFCCHKSQSATHALQGVASFILAGPLFTLLKEAEQGFRINTASFQLCSAHDFNTVPLDHPVLTRCEILAKADNLAARKFSLLSQP